MKKRIILVSSLCCVGALILLCVILLKPSYYRVITNSVEPVGVIVPDEIYYEVRLVGNPQTLVDEHVQHLKNAMLDSPTEWKYSIYKLKSNKELQVYLDTGRQTKNQVEYYILKKEEWAEAVPMQS